MECEFCFEKGYSEVVIYANNLIGNIKACVECIRKIDDEQIKIANRAREELKEFTTMLRSNKESSKS